MKTARDWVEYCAAEMEQAGLHFGHGTDNPGDEAAWLLLHIMGMPLDGSFDEWDRRLCETEIKNLENLLKHRIEDRCPLAYLTGETRFCGLDFFVTPDVLVPRSPLAELIREQFSPWLEFKAGDRVLDMCTGGGCIAIAMAHYLPGVFVDAADISPAALAVARRNVERHQVQERLSLIESDLFSACDEGSYKLIVSNPPYVSSELYAQLPPEYLAEPGVGLVSGCDGLDLALMMLAACTSYLEADGVLVMEVGESAPALAELLPRVPFMWFEFQDGGDGVFMLEYDQLIAHRDDVRQVLEWRD